MSNALNELKSSTKAEDEKQWSSSTSGNSDRKPRAIERRVVASEESKTTNVDTFNDDARWNQGHVRSPRRAVGTNPFFATTLSERAEHFPPFDAVFLNDSVESNNLTDQTHNSTGDVGTTKNPVAVNLSISVLAALSEHSRHVARYGVDNSLVHDNLDNSDNDDDDENFPSSFADPLDVEWERLLMNTSTNQSTCENRSHVSLNQSVQSTSTPQNHQRTTEQIQVVTSRSPDGVETEAIEVMTELSCSDFLNTSLPISILCTPEHVKKQQEQDELLFDNENGVTARWRTRDIHNTSSDSATSHGSLSDDSTRKLRNLYLNSLLPPSTPQIHNNDSSSVMSAPTLHINKSTDSNSNHHIATTSSFSLQNVDLSRISADDDDEIESSNIIKDLDHSFTSASIENDNNSAMLLPTVIDRFDIGIHLQDYDQTPSTTNSRSRKTITEPFGSRELLSGSLSSPARAPTERWHGSPKSTTFSPSNKKAVSDTSQYRTIDLSSPKHMPVPSPDRETQAGLMELSPISRQAADRAISILQSTPNWYSPSGSSAVSIRPPNVPLQEFSNPFQLEPLPDLIPGMNDSSHPSRSYDSSNTTLNVIEFEHQSRSTSTNSENNHEIHISGENDISPLHSSAEPNSNTDTSNSETRQHNSDSIESVAHPTLTNSSDLQNSSSGSDENLKKNSLSSISPNTSSEHHITTKPTAATTTNSRSSSSYSVSSNASKGKNFEVRTAKPRHEEGSTRDISNVPKAHTTIVGLPTFFTDRNDRRRYRTVVPMRVFLDEPHHFPNEDDSFTLHHHYHTTKAMSSLSVSSLPILSSETTTGGHRRHQNHDRLLERSISSNPW